MKKLIALLLGMTMILSACGGAKTVETSKQMEIKRMYPLEATVINYLNSTQEIELEIAANIIDGLIEYDKYGVVKPAMAESWTQSEDGLTWTFNIRKGVKWVNVKGEEVAEVKATDFVEGLKYVLTAENQNNNEWIIDGVVKNAQAYYEGTVTDFNEVGVKAIDDYTLEYTLEKPTPYFLSMTAYVCYMPVNGAFLAEKGATFGTDTESLLYNGAYILKTFEPQQKQIMEKNPLYWDKDNVFITKITSTYNAEANKLAPEMFVRGEINNVNIPVDVLDEWKNDPVKSESLRPRLNEFYSFFYAFNFNPQFDQEFEPENWTKAVNNENFRLSIMHALDRKAAMMTEDPINPEARLINTITPPMFALNGDKDFTDYGALKDIKARDSFNSEQAVSFRDKAKAELEGNATFPIKVLLPYNPSNELGWANRSQVVEQQLEGLLGQDYIDVIVQAGPATGFNAEVRRSGKFALIEANWGPDYADPETYTSPFAPGSGTYNKPELVEGYVDDNGEKTYANLLNKAKDITLDIDARYEAFAEAEAFLIEKAFVIPYAVNNPGYIATYLAPFDAQYSTFGGAYKRYKGRTLLEKPMNTETFNAEYKVWLAEREKALAAAK